MKRYLAECPACGWESATVDSQEEASESATAHVSHSHPAVFSAGGVTTQRIWSFYTLDPDEAEAQTPEPPAPAQPPPRPPAPAGHVVKPTRVSGHGRR